MPVHGTVEPGFEEVREVFEHSVAKDELGAAVCAYVDGRKVVDLWGGWADGERTRERQRDTIACVYSATKGMTATCAHLLVDRGLLDVDEPVATYWPEFAGRQGEDHRRLARGGELDGVKVLRAQTIEAALREQPLAHAEGTAGDFRLGYMLLWKAFPFGTHKPFGHTGMGGSIGLADPEQKLGFGYVMNKVGSSAPYALLPAIYKTLTEA